MKAFAQFLRVFVSLSLYLCGTATLQGLTSKLHMLKYKRRSNHVTLLKTEHAVGPLRRTDEPYNGVTKSMTGQLRRGLTPGKKSLQDVIDLEQHGAKSIKSRHQNSVAMIDQNNEIKLNSLTPVSTRFVYLLTSCLTQILHRHLSRVY